MLIYLLCIFVKIILYIIIFVIIISHWKSVRYYEWSYDCVTLHDQMSCIICMAVNDDTFKANTLYVMLCYAMLCYVMYVLTCFVIRIHLRNFFKSEMSKTRTIYLASHCIHFCFLVCILIIHSDSFCSQR